MRKIKLEINKYYHVYNRGAHKNEVFKDEHDYFRFLKNIWTFNNNSTAHQRDYIIRQFYEEHQTTKLSFRYRKLSFSYLLKYLLDLPKLVDIICYNLLPNHYHFILKQLADNGIESFMHKLGTGYTKYFQARRKHSGSLFQGPFKAFSVNEENKLAWLSGYVNCNYEIHKLGKAQEWQFSSFRDYLNLRGGELVNKQPVLKLFNHSIESYRKYCHNVIKEAQNEKEARKYLLD